VGAFAFRPAAAARFRWLSRPYFLRNGHGWPLFRGCCVGQRCTSRIGITASSENATPPNLQHGQIPHSRLPTACRLYTNISYASTSCRRIAVVTVLKAVGVTSVARLDPALIDELIQLISTSTGYVVAPPFHGVEPSFGRMSHFCSYVKLNECLPAESLGMQ